MQQPSPVPVKSPHHPRRALSLLAAAAVSLALGSGGGTPSGGGGGTTSTIPFVLVNAYPSITLGQTANCAAQVIGTGAYSSAVTWTATDATITSAGVLTPTAVGTATCTAPSTQDTT